MLAFIKEHKAGIAIGTWFVIEMILLALTTTSAVLLYSGCEIIKSCNYQVDIIKTPDNYTLYAYEYLLNGRSGCREWCNEPYNISTCPINGSICYITPFVRNYCSVYGFDRLFYCINETYNAMFISCFILFLSFLVTAFVVVCTYPKKHTGEETTPIYSGSQS